jgi:D-alanyl-D-alanine carboxypeptidase
MFRKTLTGVLATLALVPAAASTPAKRPELQQLLDAVVRAGTPGIAVYRQDGKDVWRGASGYAELGGAPMRASDHVRIGSVTKTFTAAVVLQLVAEKKLHLGDSVERWLPGLVPNGAQITVRQLLAHQSGLADFDDPDGLLAPRAVVAAAVAQPPLFAPGSHWSYSNTNYIVLGLIVQAATRTTFAAQLRKRILVPLKLTQTRFERSPTDTALPEPYAHGYDLTTPGATRDVTAAKGHFTAGSIVSTVDDVARFYRALLEGKLLPAPLLKTMLSTVAIGSAAPGAPSDHWGLGIRAERLTCGLGWGHTGELPGYGMDVYATRTATRIVVVAYTTNREWIDGALLGLLESTGFCGR